VRPPIDLVVTDLDDTLYDWVGWYTAGLAVLADAVAGCVGVSADRVLDELRPIHVARGTVEDVEAILVLPAVLARWPDPATARRELAPAFEAHAHATAEPPRLHPGVRESLARMRRGGVRVVAFTDAPAARACDRLRALDLFDALDRVYVAAPTDERDVRLVTLDPPLGKPHPRALHEICVREGIHVAGTLVIGDSLARDVALAQRAGAWSAFAAYGSEHEPASWERLCRVSHFPAAEIARAQAADIDVLRAAADAILHASLDEVFDHFDLEPASRREVGSRYHRAP
jgi:phosphoglycolate phosphatase